MTARGQTALLRGDEIGLLVQDLKGVTPLQQDRVVPTFNLPDGEPVLIGLAPGGRPPRAVSVDTRLRAHLGSHIEVGAVHAAVGIVLASIPIGIIPSTRGNVENMTLACDDLLGESMVCPKSLGLDRAAGGFDGGITEKTRRAAGVFGEIAIRRTVLRDAITE